MTTHRSLLTLTVAAIVALAPAAWAAEKIPPELAARRSGKVSQGTPPALEMIFTPIAPCRVDRKDFTSDQSISLQITGTCDVPASARAVAVNFTASPTTSGYLTAYADGELRPTAASLNYRAAIPATSGSTIPLSSAGKMAIYASGASRIYIDVTGYYRPQMEAYILSSGTISDQTGRLLSSTKTGTGTYSLQWDRDVTYCSVVVSPDFSAKYATGYTSGTFTYIYVFNSSGAPVDYWFNVHVNC